MVAGHTTNETWNFYINLSNQKYKHQKTTQSMACTALLSNVQHIDNDNGRNYSISALNICTQPKLPLLVLAATSGTR